MAFRCYAKARARPTGREASVCNTVLSDSKIFLKGNDRESEALEGCRGFD